MEICFFLQFRLVATKLCLRSWIPFFGDFIQIIHLYVFLMLLLDIVYSLHYQS